MSKLLASLECIGGWLGLWIIVDECRKSHPHCGSHTKQFST